MTDGKDEKAHVVGHVVTVSERGEKVRHVEKASAPARGTGNREKNLLPGSNP